MLIVVALACAGVAVFYFTQDTTFLAGPPARIQLKHGIAFAVVAVVALIAANMIWRAGRRV